MAIQTYDFPAAVKGDTYNQISFEVLEGETGSQTPVDLTGVKIFMYLRVKPGNSPKAKQFDSNGNGITITEPLNGKFIFDEQVIDIIAAKYEYDIQFFFTDGSTKTWLKGTWEICQDVTDVSNV